MASPLMRLNGHRESKIEREFRGVMLSKPVALPWAGELSQIKLVYNLDRLITLSDWRDDVLGDIPAKQKAITAKMEKKQAPYKDGDKFKDDPTSLAALAEIEQEHDKLLNPLNIAAATKLFWYVVDSIDNPYGNLVLDRERPETILNLEPAWARSKQATPVLFVISGFSPAGRRFFSEVAEQVYDPFSAPRFTIFGSGT